MSSQIYQKMLTKTHSHKHITKIALMATNSQADNKKLAGN